MMADSRLGKMKLPGSFGEAQALGRVNKGSQAQKIDHWSRLRYFIGRPECPFQERPIYPGTEPTSFIHRSAALSTLIIND